MNLSTKSKPITIMYVIDSLMAGGLERQFVELVKRLDKTSYQIHVVCLYGPNAGRSLIFSEELTGEGISTLLLDLDWSAVSKLQAIQKITQIVYQYQPDIVHAFNYHSNLLTRLARPMWQTNTKLVASVRNAQTRKQKFYDWASQGLFDAIICNGKQLRDSLIQEVKIPANKVYLILNGIDLERFRSVEQTTESIPLPNNAHRIILMLGRITEQKSPHLLAEAIGILNSRKQWRDDDKVFIVGEMQRTDQMWYDKLISVIDSYYLHDIVYIRSATDSPESLYHDAYITVLPSLWEGLPNVMLESLASGTPIIISNAANEAEVVQHGREGWVVPTRDVEALANTLHDAMTISTDKYKKMQGDCLRTVETFKMQTMIDSHEVLYNQLVRSYDS